MKYTTRMLLLLVSHSITTHTFSFENNTLQTISSFFKRHTLEKVDQKELPAQSLQSISIENYHGPITIKTGWDKNYLCLKTIRRAKKQTDLDAIKIMADSTKPHHLAIKTYHAQEKIKGSVEYELIVPSWLAISLKTEKGHISIHDIKSPIHAITHKGNISIAHTTNTIYAKTISQGNISINDSQGAIEAFSEYGTIAIENASNNVIAHSTKGKVSINCASLPDCSTIKLTTDTGNIVLGLPHNTNTILKSTTSYGTITSDHYITLNQYTTKLNHDAWNKLKKEIHGTIGTGNSHVTLCSTHGNIKILKSTLS